VEACPKKFILNVCYVLLFCMFCAVLCVCFCTGHIVIVHLNLTLNIFSLNILYCKRGSYSPFFIEVVKDQDENVFLPRLRLQLILKHGNTPICGYPETELSPISTILNQCHSEKSLNFMGNKFCGLETLDIFINT